MFIARNYELSQVKDFIKHIKPKLNDNKVATEVYKSNSVVGWEISDLITK